MRLLCINLRKSKIYVNLNHNTSSKKYSTEKWKGVIGLEVHAQINSVSKLFSGASTSFGERVNNSVSLFDAAVPGTLPVINKKCVESGVLTALALSCTINPISLFDRKHYFYADLPAGYQITQQRKPLAEEGVLNFIVHHPGMNQKPYKKSSHIRQIQLEQDSGKSLHDDIAKRSLVDLNRAGIPLMEIVFKPDLENGEEAASLVKELIRILKALKTCNCKMEEGSLRVDANVSVHQPGTPLGVRSEIKNIGSVRGVANAIDFEIKRQIKLLSSGIKVINETRNWDSDIGETIPMRDKEEKQDYRFMPEPNLPPLFVNVSNSSKVQNRNIVNVDDINLLMPELPEATRHNLITQHSLPRHDVYILMDDENLLKMFKNIVASNSARKPKTVVNILVNEILRFVSRRSISLEQCDEKIENIVGEVIDLVESRKINLASARSILEVIIDDGSNLSPTEIMKERRWQLISDPTEIKHLCESVIKDNPKMVEQYKSGKQKVFKALLGQVAKVSNKSANMAIVDKILKELLTKPEK